MESLGYKNYYQVLNAKDYGIPQNRERVFTISIRNDIDKEYIFPEKQELKLKLKDMLEDNVDEKYYLSDKMIKYISATGTANFRNPDCKINLDIARPLTTDQNKRAGTTNYLSNDLPDNYDLNEVNKVGHIPQWHQRGGIYDENGLAPTICATDYKTPKLTTIKIKNATKKGYIEASDGDSVNLAYPDSKTRRGRVGEQVSQTLQCNDSMGVIEKNKYSEESLKRIKQNIIKNDIANTLTANAMQSFNHNNCALINNDLRIRKLTPKECWRLMGFDDEDFEKASQVNSNAQLYKQAGNSIVVNVLMAIFNELLKKEGE
jgi:DNA (cytosine-5)-methyltransferase 1